MNARPLLLALLLPAACDVPRPEREAARASAAEAPRDTARTAYVPADLEDALRELARVVPPAEAARLRAMTEDQALGATHFGLGAWMRDEWGLGRDSPLQRWFRGQGVEEADDTSGIVLRAWWRRMNGVPFTVEELVARIPPRAAGRPPRGVSPPPPPGTLPRAAAGPNLPGRPSSRSEKGARCTSS